MPIKYDPYANIMCHIQVHHRPHGCFGKLCLELDICENEEVVKIRSKKPVQKVKILNSVEMWQRKKRLEKENEMNK